MRARIASSGMDFWAVLAAAAVATLLLIAATQMQAQTYTVIHDFTGGADGAYPYTGLTIDRAGNLYGTASVGGFRGNDCASIGGSVGGCGNIFKLSRAGSSWVFAPLYQFKGTFPNGDGAWPYGRVIFGPDGALYGTTLDGGVGGENCGASGPGGCGTVFKLTPSPTFCSTVLCSWQETRLYAFTGTPDGINPEGEIAFDAAGNLYGATETGGSGGNGTLFRLTSAHGSWPETVLYNFQGRNDGGGPRGGVAVDQSGNVYGTTWSGGAEDFGTVIQLESSGPGWTLNTLHSFGVGDDGFGSYASVIIDQSGNLYGATVNGDPNGAAYVYELSPSNGGWAYNLLHAFNQSYGAGPAANVVMDSAGNLYGTTRGVQGAPSPWGNVFKLTPSVNGWIYTDLYDFTGGSDGGVPYSSVVVDASGNIFGTTTEGGQHGYGVVFEITPN